MSPTFAPNFAPTYTQAQVQGTGGAGGRLLRRKATTHPQPIKNGTPGTTQKSPKGGNFGGGRWGEARGSDFFDPPLRGLFFCKKKHPPNSRPPPDCKIVCFSTQNEAILGSFCWHSRSWQLFGSFAQRIIFLQKNNPFDRGGCGKR